MSSDEGFIRERLEKTPEWYKLTAVYLRFPERVPSLVQLRRTTITVDLKKALVLVAAFLDTQTKAKSLSEFCDDLLLLWDTLVSNSAWRSCISCSIFSVCGLTLRLMRGEELDAVKEAAWADAKVAEVCNLLNSRPLNEYQLLLKQGATGLNTINRLKASPSFDTLEPVNLLRAISLGVVYEEVRGKTGLVQGTEIEGEGEASIFSNLRTLSDKAREPFSATLPEDIYIHEMLYGDSLMGSVSADRSRAPVNITVYLDYSGSMSGEPQATALALGCLFIDSFAPYGCVRVVPFDEWLLYESGDQVEFCENGSSEFMLKNLGERSYGGTRVQYCLTQDALRNNHVIHKKGFKNYLVLITDALDLTVRSLPKYFDGMREKGVYAASLWIGDVEEKDAQPMLKVLEKHTHLIKVSPKSFREEAPKIINHIAQRAHQ